MRTQDATRQGRVFGPSTTPPPSPKTRESPAKSSRVTPDNGLLNPEPLRPGGVDPLPEGARLGRRVVKRVLGQGGFGVTYLARDEVLDLDCAVKEYLPQLYAERGADLTVKPRTFSTEGAFDWGRERFLLEARTLARFKHPNIVRVTDFFEANNTAYMVMDYERGESLASLLRREGTLDFERVRALLLPLLSGLETLHAAGVIHRDIKPDNIYLRESGEPVLIDFGSARGGSDEASQRFTALLTPGYSPHEQYSAASRQGPYTDLYALAAVIYRILSGKKPVDAAARSAAVLEDAPDPMTPAAKLGLLGLPPAFLAAVDKALAIPPAARPQSVAQWRDMLFPEAEPADPTFADLARVLDRPGEPSQALDLSRPDFEPDALRSEPLDDDHRPLFDGILLVGPAGTTLDNDAKALEFAARMRPVIVHSAAGALDRIAQRPPELVVARAGPGAAFGIALIARQGDRFDEEAPPTLLIGTDRRAKTVYEAAQAGAIGYMFRPCPPERLASFLASLAPAVRWLDVEAELLREAQRALDEGKLDEALESYFEVASVEEDLLAEGEPGAKKLFEDALCEFALARPNKGMRLFWKAFRLKGFEAAGLQGQAKVHAALGETEAARIAQSKAGVAREELDLMGNLRLHFLSTLAYAQPGASPLVAFGVELRREKDYSRAMWAFDLALAGDPKDVKARLNLALAKALDGDRTGAAEELGKALLIDPENEEARKLYKKLTGLNFK